jgi:hypothetical protein
MMTLALASLLAALLLFGFALFHAALAFGAPLAAYAWGGQAAAGPLPPRLQLGSTILAPFIAAMGVLLLIRGGWLYPELSRALGWASWAVFLFVVTQMFGALRSSSRRERRVMSPLYVVATALCAVVGFGGMPAAMSAL